MSNFVPRTQRVLKFTSIQTKVIFSSMLKKAVNNKETYCYISGAKFAIKSAVKGEKVYWCWLAIVLWVTTSFATC